ncbi:MAG: tetratricopeptide repeat protein [Bacteroidota bacterium]
MAKKTEQTDKAEERIHAVEEALGKGEHFIEKNKNLLFYILIGILVIVGGYLGYRKFILGPKERDAQAAMWTAERYFEKDSLNLAMNGDGTNLGFVDIASQYSSTKSGNLAHYYLGVIYMKKGEFQNAIDNLEDFKSDDMIIGPMAKGLLGDAYLELGDMDKAIKFYLEAANKKNNDFTAPMYFMRAGLTYELKGDYSSALAQYEKIKKDYVKSFEAREIDKYIARAKALTATK